MLYLVLQLRRIDPAPVRDLITVGAHRPAAATHVDRTQLVLRACGIELRLVAELEQRRDRAAHASSCHSLRCSSELQRLTAPRMAAATVRPVTRPQTLVGTTLLQEELAGRVEDKQREGAMQHPATFMTARLAHEADFAVAGIDQDQWLGIR